LARIVKAKGVAVKRIRLRALTIAAFKRVRLGLSTDASRVQASRTIQTAAPAAPTGVGPITDSVTTTGGVAQ
jgi:hypothetical protein